MTGRSGSTGAETEPKPPAEATESVPGYRDLARIGHGGFSVVYRAVQESFERAVALKVLNVGPDEDARRRFLREVRLAGRLSGHPHVVTVLDTGTTASGRAYLAMDLYDGGSMKDRLRRSGPLSPVETAVAGAKIAEALAAAHSLGVLHRDVKPNNILVSRFGEPALADFGVSCLLDSSSSASVLDVFSPQHAAPELMTRGLLTASSDVYALGSTLCQLLTGQPPFGGEDRDVRSIMWRAVSEPPPRPECPGLPELADAIVRAMAKEPQERFADAAEFARTLRALIPDGAPSVLPMPDMAETLSVASFAGGAADSALVTHHLAAAAAEVPPETTFGRESTRRKPGAESDTSPAGRLRSSDETMVRPDRADPGERSSLAANRRSERDEKDHGGSAARRARKPLAVAVTVALLGVAAWAVLASRNSSAGSPTAASSHSSTATAAAYAAPTRSSARPTASTTPTLRRSTAPTAPTAKSSAAALSGSTASASSAAGGPLLPLPGSFHRLQNAQTGNCLTEPAGGSAAAQDACAGGKSDGWNYSLSLSGILAAGDFELVNEQSGLCLTENSDGTIGAQACDGRSAQQWSKVSGPGSGKEFQNAGDSQCLRAAQAVVSHGPCNTSDRADLWNEDGTA
jgi:serine/threonine-protein kinase PknK